MPVLTVVYRLVVDIFYELIYVTFTLICEQTMNDSTPSTKGTAISYKDGKLVVPDNPVIPFIEGDGIGVDITPVMIKVVDAAVKQAYNGYRAIDWLEVYAGEKSIAKHGEGQWLPQQTLASIEQYHVAIKGPLTTPVGGGIRSLNVALRQALDLYVCQRPVRYFPGTPSPLKEPELTDITIFRENSEDIYAGIEFQANTPDAKKLINFLRDDMGVDKIRFPDSTGLGVKIISEEGSKRLIRSAMDYTLAQPNATTLTLVHKGNIMKFTEGSFRDWGYQLVRDEYGAEPLDGGPWHVIRREGKEDVIINDVIADAFLQHAILRPQDFDVVATMNLNGDYISDALAAQVGGIGISPGGNLSDRYALFEPTHGTAPKYAGQDKVNPSSLLLSAEMMLHHIGWGEAAILLRKGLSRSIARHEVTYDFARYLDNVKPLW